MTTPKTKETARPVTPEDILEDLRAVVRDAEALLRATEGQAGEKINEVRDRVRSTLDDARERIKVAGVDAGERTRAAARTADTYVHENPWLVIGVADSTAPLSGSEHLTSHILDMAAMARGAEHDLHGAQVGAATVVCTALWHEVRATCRVFDVPWAELRYPDDFEERVRETWAALDPSGALGQECWTAVARKVARWNAADRSECDRNRADVLERLFGYVGDPVRAAGTLRHWGAAVRFSELNPPVSRDALLWSLRALPYMRDRLTLPDLLVMTGEWTDELIERVLARA